MTPNPRTALLLRARRRTATLVLGALAGTGALTVGVAATAQPAAGQGSGTTSGSSKGSALGSSFNLWQLPGVSSGSGSGGADGGTHAS